VCQKQKGPSRMGVARQWLPSASSCPHERPTIAYLCWAPDVGR
jgi:hypothetical protein